MRLYKYSYINTVVENYVQKGLEWLEIHLDHHTRCFITNHQGPDWNNNC